MTETVVFKQLLELMRKDTEKGMEELIVKNGIDINNIQHYGKNTSLLMLAAQLNASKCARKLIQLGADVDKRCQDGWTALIHACDSSSDDVAIALVEAGASFTLLDGPTETPNVHAAVVIAIVEKERRVHVETPKEVEAPKILPKESWLCMFLTNNGVPEEVAEDCEQKLLGEGFYSPQMLAIMPTHTFTLDYLASIGIKSRGLHYLLLALHSELYQKRSSKKEAFWTQELEEAARVDKKRARD